MCICLFSHKKVLPKLKNQKKKSLCTIIMDTLALSVAQFLLFSAFELVFNNFFSGLEGAKISQSVLKSFFFQTTVKSHMKSG